MSRLSPLLMLLAIACGKPATIEVQVTDVWDVPIAGATVVQEGVTDRFSTGSDGRVKIPVEAGTAHFMAGQDGFIKELATVEVPEDKDAIEGLTLQLYPEPEKPGFYGVDRKAYVHLEAYSIQAVASESSTIHGLKDIPKAGLQYEAEGPVRFVFSSTLRAQQLKQQNLKLSKLEFKDSVDFVGVLGSSVIQLNLWVAGEEVPFTVKGLQSRDDYLIVVEDALPKGIYAFHAQNILDPSSAGALEKLPKEMQVAFTFEVM